MINIDLDNVILNALLPVVVFLVLVWNAIRSHKIAQSYKVIREAEKNKTLERGEQIRRLLNHEN